MLQQRIYIEITHPELNMDEYPTITAGKISVCNDTLEITCKNTSEFLDAADTLEKLKKSDILNYDTGSPVQGAGYTLIININPFVKLNFYTRS